MKEWAEHVNRWTDVVEQQGPGDSTTTMKKFRRRKGMAVQAKAIKKRKTEDEVFVQEEQQTVMQSNSSTAMSGVGRRVYCYFNNDNLDGEKGMPCAILDSKHLARALRGGGKGKLC